MVDAENFATAGVNRNSDDKNVGSGRYKDQSKSYGYYGT